MDAAARRWIPVLGWLAAGAALVDATMTYLALHAGGVHEANPLMVRLFATFGTEGALGIRVVTMAGFAWVLWRIARRYRPLRALCAGMLILLAASSIAVVVSNTLVVV